MRVKSRPARWAEACSAALEAMDELDAAAARLQSAQSELDSLREEYEEWRDNLPENLQDGALADKLNTVADMELDSFAEDVIYVLGEARGIVEEAEGADLPMGFGRD